MAGPVAHIFVGYMLAQTHHVDVAMPQKWYAGHVFPDIRYVTDDVSRAQTHLMDQMSLSSALSAPSSFEQGRRVHVLLDFVRERYMMRNKAYDHVPAGPKKTQLLKLTEDMLLFPRLKDHFDSKAVFDTILPEEVAYGIEKETISLWHGIMRTYLSSDYTFDWMRLYQTAMVYLSSQKPKESWLERMQSFVRKLTFAAYAYFQLQKMLQDEELKGIIFAFYNNVVAHLSATNGRSSDGLDFFVEYTPVNLLQEGLLLSMGQEREHWGEMRKMHYNRPDLE